MKMTRRREDVLLVGVAVCAILMLSAGLVAYIFDSRRATADVSTPKAQASAEVVPDGHIFRRAQNPNRTEVTDATGNVLAVFTDSANTVRVTGPTRTFAEPKYTKAKVHTDAWIRLAPHQWRPGAETEEWFGPWLKAALLDQSPDVLAVAMEYVYGSQPVRNAGGQQIAGDAAFGPVSESDVDGRAENSDFYDYLGLPWSFPDGRQEKPNPKHIRSLDCSGYLRMVYGYRFGYPLRGTNTPGPGLPRRAYAIADFGPGVQLMPNTGKQVRELGLLQAGDLLFFHGRPEIDADGAGGSTHIEHSGIYLGIDDRGHHRFISSRTGANGPTMGDTGAESIIDGTGHFAVKLRTARRI